LRGIIARGDPKANLTAGAAGSKPPGGSFYTARGQRLRFSVPYVHRWGEAYRAPAYKEAHARQEFIDPFFVALGWDVHALV
jgi:hypothetical protein